MTPMRAGAAGSTRQNSTRLSSPAGPPSRAGKGRIQSAADLLAEPIQRGSRLLLVHRMLQSGHEQFEFFNAARLADGHDRVYRAAHRANLGVSQQGGDDLQSRLRIVPAQRGDGGD